MSLTAISPAASSAASFLPAGGSPAGTTALAAVAGAGAGLGMLLIAAGIRGRLPDPDGPARPVRRRPAGQTRRLLLAAAAGLAVLVGTRWIAAAVGVGVLVGCYDQVFGGTRRARAGTARLDALAGWTESLRDLVATGIALPEALPASVISAAPALRPALTDFADRIAGREPLEAALRALGDDLDDGGADLVVAALLLNARAQGRALEAVLSALATSLRGQLRVRRTIEAERRSTRRAVQIVITVTLLTALGLSLGNPTYVAPYRTATGQLMLAVVVGVFGTGFGWLARLSALPNAPRLLPAGPARGGSR